MRRSRLVALSAVTSGLVACSAASPDAPSTPSSAASASPSATTAARDPIDSPALALPAPSASSAAEPGTILLVSCKDGESDATCSERAKRDALRGARPGARVLAVLVESAPTAYRARVEIDGVAQNVDAATTDEVTAELTALANDGHRVKLLAMDAAPGARSQRAARVLLGPTGD